MEISRDIILKSFLVEAGEGLSQMEGAILELESNPANAEIIQTIFRVVHSIKGNAGILDLSSLHAFSHSLENLLDKIRGRELSVNAEIVNILLQSVDVLREATAAAGKGRDETGSGASAVLARISDSLEESSGPEKTINEDYEPARVRQTVPETSSADIYGKTLRVDVSKLDRLLDITGEIAIARGRMNKLLENPALADLDNLRETSSLADSLFAEFQETVLKARMVSLGPLFRQHLRTVRDVARSQGKLARLQIEGEEIEVDTSVIEHLRDPLLHMLRNAIDHGIESPAVRRQKGKPASGTVTVRAAYQSASIVIEVSDDGAGLDRERICEVARKRGLASEPEKMEEQELFQLIFEPGFSTSGSVSVMSGRGVGMDVVRRKIQALRGDVYISSKQGVHSTVHIRLPLTLAIIEGFDVGVGEETYVIPMEQVLECVELPAQGRETLHGTGILELRGEPLPYIQLRNQLQLEGQRGSRQNVVVVQHGAKRAGVVVDTLHGVAQTVIKPLPPMFRNVPGFSGSTIRGNGRVALILDLPVLLRGFELEAANASRR
jgi:two-component system, chemotaxis family, sensor kinase CheA